MSTQLDTLLNKIQKLASNLPTAIDALEKEIQRLRAEQTRLDGLYRAATGKSYLGVPSAPSATPVKAPVVKSAKSAPKKRLRRSGDELKELAGQVVALIEKAKDEGVSAADLKAKIPALSGVQSVKKFLEQYAGKGKVQTKGVKVNMRYFAK